jgi:hypothetical protein
MGALVLDRQRGGVLRCSSHFARDLIVQVGPDLSRQPSYFIDDTPTAKLVRAGAA